MGYWKVVKLEIILNKCASMLMLRIPKPILDGMVAINDPCTVFYKMTHVLLELKQFFVYNKLVKGNGHLSSCQLYPR